jgi:uncharacterized membrane protein YsdA (DUF1294 family)
MPMPFDPSPINIATAAAILNIWTFMMFGFDKIRAEKGNWRIAESTLLWLAFIGGTGGAYMGRVAFRHKTRKQPFSKHLHIIATIQAFAGVMAAGWFFAGP